MPQISFKIPRMTLEDRRRTPGLTSDDDTTVVDVAVVPEPRQTPPRYVDLGDGRMGLQTDVFNLAGMFDFDSDDDFHGSGRVTDVYFRTESGNVYLLDRNGRLINRDESVITGTISVENLDPFALSEADDLEVGRSFRYERRQSHHEIWQTTAVIEIVVTSDLMRASSSVTMGRQSGIVTDFLKDLPPIPAVGEQV